MSDADGTPTGDADEDAGANEVPDWDDEYVDRVSDRLMFNYDLEKDYRVEGESFTLYGRMEVHSQKQLFHPVISYGHHDAIEHLFVRRLPRVDVPVLERHVDLGHDLAERWIDPDEEHYRTDFTFVLVTGSLPDDVREFVADFRDRTLLKYGYFGHYEVNLAVVAPEAESLVASQEADVARAFRLWAPMEDESKGLLERLFG